MYTLYSVATRLLPRWWSCDGLSGERGNGAEGYKIDDVLKLGFGKHFEIVSHGVVEGLMDKNPSKGAV